MKKIVLLFTCLVFGTCSCAQQEAPKNTEEISFCEYVLDVKGNIYVIFDAYKEDNYIVLNGNFKFINFQNFSNIFYVNEPEIYINLSKTINENDLETYNMSKFTFQGKLSLYFNDTGFDYDSGAWLFNLQVNSPSKITTYFKIDGEQLEELKNESI